MSHVVTHRNRLDREQMKRIQPNPGDISRLCKSFCFWHVLLAVSSLATA